MEIRANAEHLVVMLPGHDTASDQPSDGGQGIVMSWQALTTWQNLLGLESVGETVQAILESASNPQPETIGADGRNAWTLAYETLEAALNDTVPTTLAMTAQEAHMNDPLTVAQQQTMNAVGIQPTASISLIRQPSTPSVPSLDVEAIDATLAGNTTAINALADAQEDFFAQFIPEERNNNER